MTELNNFIIEQLKDEEFQKEYMNESLNEYINDGDFNAFFRSLELVIKSRDIITKASDENNDMKLTITEKEISLFYYAIMIQI